MDTLEELREVLSRQRIRHYIPLGTIQRFLASLTRFGRWIDVDLEIVVCRDPKDDKFLSLAVSGGATYIVTGDKDLLVLDPFQGIRILTPRAFLELP